MSRDFQRIEELYHQALSRPEADRANFLASTCAGDEELRREVDALLACQQKAGQFMDSPALDVAARILARTNGRTLTGSRLGPYQVLSLLGVGGMGEVYRALDTKLNRNVALKVLPEALAQAPERMARFQREAQMLAALNHPNIAAIYGLEECDGTRALVMELVEGPTLAERLLRSPLASGSSPSGKGEPPSSPPLHKGGPPGGVPLPLEEVLPIAKQVAEGLEYAHERGIIHRDLKPANVKITPEGFVKILDFGLAKAAEGTGVTGDPVSSPTPAMPATQTGLILGTAAYMAPEQARGQMVDKRADIWAFGVVLYEMLTGRQLFVAETVSDTLVAVLKSYPDLTVLPEAVPASIRKLVRRCLERDRKRRLQAIGDARIEIEECLMAPVGAAEVEASSAVQNERALRQRERRVWVLVATVLLLATIASLLTHFKPTRTPATAIISEIPPPANARFDFNGASGGPPVISPDGRSLAFSAVDANGERLLWVRSLDSLAAQPLAEEAAYPFWSKDSRALGFFAEGCLQTIEASGGLVKVVAPAPFAAGGSWNRDGTILFTSVTQKALYRVAASGGVPAPIIKLDATKYWACAWPTFLPDAKHFLYTAYSDDPTLEGTYFASLDGKENRLLVEKAWDAAYAQGFLLYTYSDSPTLMRQAFDPERGQLKGDPHPLAEEIARGYRDVFDVSENGVLIYQKAGGRRLGWFDRTGRELDFRGQIPAFGVRLSPDGRKLAFHGYVLNGNVYVDDLARGVATAVTNDNVNRTGLAWSPDLGRILFAAVASTDRLGIYQKSSSGAGAEELLLASEAPDTTIVPSSWSSDGRYILYDCHEGVGPATHLRSEIWLLPLEGDRKPRVFVQAPVEACDGQFSPDSRWVAYTLRESSGREEVYVVPFDADGVLNKSSESTNAKAAARWHISASGGSYPRWRRDGKEIFYLSSANQIMAVPVQERGKSLQVQTAQPLFRSMVAPWDAPYDVTPDGKKFVISVPTSPNMPLTLVVNWTGLLREK